MPGSKSIANSISQSGGSPGTSWKTWGKFCATGTLPRFDSRVSFAITAHRYAAHPLPINLQALAEDMTETVGVESPPYTEFVPPRRWLG